MERSSGILLPIFSLPSPGGIGTLGRAAYEFADFLHRAGQSWWQILPVSPAGDGDSPYQSVSSYAGNPLLIDPELLAAEGLLLPQELAAADGGRGNRIDYAKVNETRLPLLRKAFERGREKDAERLMAFSLRSAGWLPDYALFMAAKDRFGGAPWTEWPDEALRRHEAGAVERYRAELSQEVRFYTYVQFLFYGQWEKMKAYANGLGIRILGDLPIYVAPDSADVWAAQESFLLDREGFPTAVAGVPPDYFCAEGQLWGNPLYDWKRMRADGFGWWIRRIDGAARLFDAIRMDHFRAFASYWAVPAGAETAKEGHWEPGPGMELLGVLTSWFPQLTFIAEDLGILTPDVLELLRASGLPGMKVLEFAFSGGAENAYLPHNYAPHCVCYTGTHDNAPLADWQRTASRQELRAAEEYLGLSAREGFSWGVIRGGQSSVAELFIAQMQDYLERPDARINTPGTPRGNWRWRLLPGEIDGALADRIRTVTERYGRCGPKGD